MKWGIYMFLSIFDDKKGIVFLASIIFMIAIIVIWVVVYLIIRRKKYQEYEANGNKEYSNEELENLSTEPEVLEDENVKENNENIEENKNEEEIIPLKNKDEDISNSNDENNTDTLNSCDNELNEKSGNEFIEQEENNKEDLNEESTVDNNTLENALENNDDKENNNDESLVLNEKNEDLTDESNIDNKEENIEELNVIENKELSENTIEDKKEDLEDSNKKKELNSISKPKKNANRTYNGKYVVFEDSVGYAYILKASNGEILVKSESYASREGVTKAIKAVKRNVEEGTIKISSDKRGNYKFKLISKNYRLLAISMNYSQEKNAIRASKSFQKFALIADIVDEKIDDESKNATSININKENILDGGIIEIEKYDGEFSWTLKDDNNNILCIVEGYSSKLGLMNSIENFKKNIESGEFKLIKLKNDEYKYILYNDSGKVCLNGQTYKTKEEAIDVANKVYSYYKDAKITEIKG